MFVGSCLCGVVKWRVDAALAQMNHCHCSMCRKSHGSAFATFSGVKPDAFKWLNGEIHVQQYKASDSLTRGFCDCCGSSMPQKDAARGRFSVPLGCMDDDPVVRAEHHIFADSKAPWYTWLSDLPTFASRVE